MILINLYNIINIVYWIPILLRMYINVKHFLYPKIIVLIYFRFSEVTDMINKNKNQLTVLSNNDAWLIMMHG